MEEKDDEDMDALVLYTSNSKLEAEVSLEDIARSHRLRARIYQQGDWRDDAETNGGRHQAHTSFIMESESH